MTVVVLQEEEQLYLRYDRLLAYVSEHARRSSITQELALEEVRRRRRRGRGRGGESEEKVSD